jgi:hypothetical protein
MSLLDILRGRAITIPPLDGAFRPNTLLEDAEAIARLTAPDDLIVVDGRVFCSSGDTVVALGETQPVARFDVRVACLAARPGGGFAAGLEDGRIILWQAGSGPEIARPAGLDCPTALLFLDRDRLAVAQGARGLKPSDWVRSIMGHDRSGAVWLLDAAGGAARRLADGLAFPWGLAANVDNLIVSECGRHRLLSVPLSGGPAKPLLTGLPGYPARLTPAAAGGGWLAIAAPRNRLIEFVLREDDYRQSMMAELDPRHWIAPALASGRNFLEPLQCGGVRSMGVHKPWAPTRSYGLVVRLDARWQPVSSAHSRAGGQRHGVTGVVEHDSRLLVASQGGDVVVVLP